MSGELGFIVEKPPDCCIPIIPNVYSLSKRPEYLYSALSILGLQSGASEALPRPRSHGALRPPGAGRSGRCRIAARRGAAALRGRGAGEAGAGRAAVGCCHGSGKPGEPNGRSAAVPRGPAILLMENNVTYYAVLYRGINKNPVGGRRRNGRASE